MQKLCNPVGDVSFNGNLFTGNNLTVSGIITNYYTQSQVNTLVAPTTAISYNTVNVFTDYITNRKFSSPTIATNDYWPYFFDNNQLNAFSWTTTTTENLYIIKNGQAEIISLNNGLPLVYPSPTLINAVQYIWLDTNANIQQVIDNLPAGVYELSFKYAFLPEFPANPIRIFFMVF